jgi:hypothetical protein
VSQFEIGTDPDRPPTRDHAILRAWQTDARGDRATRISARSVPMRLKKAIRRPVRFYDKLPAIRTWKAPRKARFL